VRLKTKVIAGAAAVAAVAGAGAAIAAGQFGDPQQERQAVINDVAQQLNVQPQALSDALKKALKNRVDAAQEAGRLTEQQANEIKSRIDSGDMPFFMGGGPMMGGHFGGFDRLDAAAKYLDLSSDQLRTQLQSGKSLADIAKAQGKSVEGLVQALVDDAKKHLDDARANGRITQAQEDQILTEIKSRVTDMVNGTFRGFGGPGGPMGGGFRGPGGGFGPPGGGEGFGPPSGAAFGSNA